MERTAVEIYAYILSGFKPVYDAFSTVLNHFASSMLFYVQETAWKFRSSSELGKGWSVRLG